MNIFLLGFYYLFINFSLLNYNHKHNLQPFYKFMINDNIKEFYDTRSISVNKYKFLDFHNVIFSKDWYFKYKNDKHVNITLDATFDNYGRAYKASLSYITEPYITFKNNIIDVSNKRLEYISLHIAYLIYNENYVQSLRFILTLLSSYCNRKPINIIL